MTNPDHDRPDAEQISARHVGESLSTGLLQPPAFENAGRSGAEIGELVERVCWLMRREPMLEREMPPWVGV
jgi:hypothetical protein